MGSAGGRTGQAVGGSDPFNAIHLAAIGRSLRRTLQLVCKGPQLLTACRRWCPSCQRCCSAARASAPRSSPPPFRSARRADVGRGRAWRRQWVHVGDTSLAFGQHPRTVTKHTQKLTARRRCNPAATPQPTCSSGNTVHLTGAVTGVKRNTVRCEGAREHTGMDWAGRIDAQDRGAAARLGAGVHRQLVDEECLCSQTCQHSCPPTHLVVALPRVEGVLKQAVQDAANAKRRLNHAGREVPAGGRRAVRGWLGNTDATHC